jgi:hypothetical protein
MQNILAVDISIPTIATLFEGNRWAGKRSIARQPAFALEGKDFLAWLWVFSKETCPPCYDQAGTASILTHAVSTIGSGMIWLTA